MLYKYTYSFLRKPVTIYTMTTHRGELGRHIRMASIISCVS